jgi:iron complex transport system ATP-binding protein
VPSLAADAVSLRRGNRNLLDAVSCHLGGGELVVLLGPNGAGKTSLLRVLLGLERPDEGLVTLGGQPVARLDPLTRARSLAYLPQQQELAWPLTVRDVVALGRYAYGAAAGRLSAEDRRAVNRALSDCELETLAARDATTLSGGEQARMHCARALAVEAPLLLADEPVAALDPLHQHRLMALLRRRADVGQGVLVVLHDVALAARYADRLLWLKSGRLLAAGGVDETLSAARLREVYDVAARVNGREVLIDG